MALSEIMSDNFSAHVLLPYYVLMFLNSHISHKTTSQNFLLIFPIQQFPQKGFAKGI